MASTLFVKGTFSGAVGGNAPIFGQDIVPGTRAGKAIDFIVEVTLSAGSANLEVSFDSQATWTPIILTVSTGILSSARVLVQTGDAVNFRMSVGVTISRMVVIGDITG